MMTKRLMTGVNAGVVVAALLLAAACGDDAGEQGTQAGAPAPSDSSAPADTTTTGGVAGGATDEAQLADWADDVAGIHEELAATQGELAVQFTDMVLRDADDSIVPEHEVDGYRFLTAADARAVESAVEQMPPSPADSELAAPYEAFLDALRAEAVGADALAEEIDADLDSFKQEVIDAMETPDGPFGRFDEIRRQFSELQNDTTAACFDIQAAMVERGLALLDCTGE